MDEMVIKVNTLTFTIPAVIKMAWSLFIKHAEDFPIIPGIDLAGVVIESTDDRFKKGDAVIATIFKLIILFHFIEVAILFKHMSCRYLKID